MSQYCILPNKPEQKAIPVTGSIPLAEWERKNVEGLNGGVGCLVWVVACIVIGGLSKSFFAGVMFASIAVVMLTFLIKSSKISDLEQKKAEDAKRSTENENQAAIRRVESEASSLTSSLLRTYESSTTLVSDLPKHLNQASRLLQDAESEYKANAFGPFWDMVENAANQLAAYNEKANQLSRYAEDYYRKLDGKNHTFPKFPIQVSTIPAPTPILNELRRVVRIGQTNFQFANIWEHRRTREVLIAGFQTLGEAVNNLGATIENSVYRLEQSVSTDLAKLVHEGIRTRETLDNRSLEQNRMLDNIQHHRKPGIIDTPTKY